tara:strand:- start:253 stop:717 length:465 start_codon:yes stop_codon:yes gene_type:complete
MKKEILFEDIYARHPYKYKGAKSLDLKLFPNEILFKQKKLRNSFFIYQTKFMVVNIKDTLHSKYLNFPEKYTEIYENYIEITNQKEHSISKYKYLIENFDIKLLENYKISLHPYEYEDKLIYIITDGVHRSSLCVFNSIKSLSRSNYEIDINPL